MNYLYILSALGFAYTPDSVHYYRQGLPVIVMEFEEGITHVEPRDEQEVDYAIEKCQEGYGPNYYPVKLRKIGKNDYQTICGKIEDHRN